MPMVFNYEMSLQYNLISLLLELKFEIGGKKGDQLQVWPLNIYMLFDSGHQKNKLMNALKERCFPVGSIEEQREQKKNVLAIDSVENGLSFEWAVIMYVSDNNSVSNSVPSTLPATSQLYVLGVGDSKADNEVTCILRATTSQHSSQCDPTAVIRIEPRNRPEPHSTEASVFLYPDGERCQLLTEPSMYALDFDAPQTSSQIISTAVICTEPTIQSNAKPMAHGKRSSRLYI